MSDKNSEDHDYISRIVEQAETDANEVATENLDLLESLFDYNIGEQCPSSLIARLNADPHGSFYVTGQSKYSDNYWTFPSVKGLKRYVFNSEIQGANELYRSLTFFLMPDFNPFGRIKSYSSTVTYANCFVYLEKFLFLPNALRCDSSSITAITPRLLNEALDKAKEYSARAYSFTYFMICFWISLSTQKLLPSSHSISVPLSKIRTKARYKDILAAIAEEHIGWEPLSEDDLQMLVEHALFWAEKGLPKLLEIGSYLESIGALSQKHAPIIRGGQGDAKLEKLLGTKIDGTEICGFRHRKFQQEVDGRFYDMNSYSWRQGFKLAVDKVLESVIILLSLVTGMRNREMGILTFEDLFKSDAGNWFLSISRFKTNHDPNFYGEHDEIPLPEFIGDLISDYRELRAFVEMFSHKRSLMLTTVFDVREETDETHGQRAIGRVLAKIAENLGFDGSLHHHRFRKTIAEILIRKSEKNIDLIRMLFGHKSYRMSLKYIARNPYLIESITNSLSEHFTADFVHIVNSVSKGGYSGEAAERIASMVQQRPELFKGKLIRMSVRRYIAYILEAGEPIFIKRTTLGTYCVSTDKYSKSNRPPCITHIYTEDEEVSPDVSNCQLQCKNVVVLEDAKEALISNVRFYENLLAEASESMSKKAITSFRSQIQINTKHLAELNNTGCKFQTEIVELKL